MRESWRESRSRQMACRDAERVHEELRLAKQLLARGPCQGADVGFLSASAVFFSAPAFPGRQEQL